MTAYCRNPQCKNYRKPTELRTVDLGTNYYDHGVLVAGHDYEQVTYCCDRDRFWQDEDEMIADTLRDLKAKLDDATFEQMLAIERLLAPSPSPSLEDELRDLAGIGGKQ